jgi:predicted RNase H-like HicB family nuclease
MKSKGKNQVAATAAHGPYHYTVYFEPQTDGSFAVVFPAFPEVVTFGRTLDEARAMARDALRCHLEGLRKDGEAIVAETPPGRASRFAKRSWWRFESGASGYQGARGSWPRLRELVSSSTIRAAATFS